MTIQIIGAGFGRTGTDSLRHAINMLGLGPCHHMHEVGPNEVQTARWLQKVDGQEIGWDQLFEGFGSAVDWPSAHYWPETMQTYPEAIVVLTYRDPESWWESYSRTIMQIPGRLPEESMPVRLMHEVLFPEGHDNKAHVLRRYAENIDRFRAEVPEARRIEIGLGDGWGPLCAGLGIAEPAAPYPSGNTTQNFRDNFKMDG